MTRRVDHGHDHQAEDKTDADDAECTAVLVVGDDRTAAGEDEREGRGGLGRCAAA